MRGLLDFARRHVLAVIGIVIGAAWMSWGFYANARDLVVWTAGLEPWAWQIIGAVIVIFALFTILYRIETATKAKQPEPAKAEAQGVPENTDEQRKRARAYYKSDEPDYAPWDNMQSVYLYQAGYMLADLIPPGEEYYINTVKPYVQMLWDSVRSQEIAIVGSGREPWRTPNAHHRVAIDELRRYAE